jgi:D-alanine-D-alanine ligase
MQHIAILAGGPSAEREISLQSAELVEKYLDPGKYSFRTIVLEKGGWFEKNERVKVDLNDFSLTFDGKKETFDFVFLIIHGTPAEDGKIQGYFEYLGIPHSTCDTLVSALTFNKQMCKDYLKAFEIPMAPSRLLKKDQSWEPGTLIKQLGLPLFVKPNSNGSSYGVSKVTLEKQLNSSVDQAFVYDDEVIVETFLAGMEVSAGVVREGNVLHAFPVTEIVPKKEFFDYEAKYKGASDEITPARLPIELLSKCEERSKAIYGYLGCRSMVRFDYILVDEEFYLLEANTIPGLSEASIVPQQAIAYGWTITKLLDVVIEDCLSAR